MKLDKLLEHVGCRIEIAVYGDSDNPDDVTIECMDHHEVLVSVDTDFSMICSKCGTEISGCDRAEHTVIADHGHCLSCQNRWEAGD